MTAKPEKSIEDVFEKFMENTFADLEIGDRETFVAQINQIKQDEKHSPPQWYLYYLFDGAKTIRAFGRAPNKINAGDFVIVDIAVKKGKPFNGKTQLTYKIISINKIEKENIRSSHLFKKFQYHEVMRKADLQTLSDGTRVKLFTKILNLHPMKGEKEKYQKILIADIEEKPISLWLKKEDFHLFEALNDDEYIILKAVVKNTDYSPTARFLSFENFIRGEEIYDDPIAQHFIEEKIKSHCQQLLTYTNLWKTYIAQSNLGIELLSLILKNFQERNYQDLLQKEVPS
ncbi:MAG: hypothetical protein ACTSYB_09395 [Candidatus Helarchaeota archaeon]